MSNAMKVVGVITLVASFGIWGYAFSGRADRPAPDLLDDTTWPAAAETLCAEALDEIESMPGALDAADVSERSTQIQTSTDRFAEMMVDLERLPVSTTRDAQITTDWLADWRTLLQDRRRHAQAIRDDPAAPFTITDTGVNERLDKRITRFATTNSLPSCVTPTDV